MEKVVNLEIIFLLFLFIEIRYIDIQKLNYEESKKFREFNRFYYDGVKIINYLRYYIS